MSILIINPSGGGGGGAVTGADNGLTLNAGIVELGGILNQVTSIGAAQFPFDISDSIPGFANRAIQLLFNRPAGSLNMQVQHSVSATHVDRAGVFTQVDSGGTPYAIFAFDQENPVAPAHIYQGFITRNLDVGPGSGILVIDDFNHTGMGYPVGSDYSVNGIANFGDSWIPPLGFLKKNLPALSTFKLQSASISQNVTTLALAAGSVHILQIACWLFGTIGAATTAHLEVVFQDPRLLATTLSLDISLTANGTAIVPTITIAANGGSNVLINLVITGVLANVDCGGQIQQQQQY